MTLVASMTSARFGGLDRAEFIAAELLARAVEALVCRALGAEYALERWAKASYLETLVHYGIQLPSPEWVAKASGCTSSDPRHTSSPRASCACGSAALASRNLTNTPGSRESGESGEQRGV